MTIQDNSASEKAECDTTVSLSEFVSTAAAAELTGKSARTMRNRCLDHGIARRVGRRWQVSVPGLDMLRANDTGALADYCNEDRTSDRVRFYFEQRSIRLPGENS